MKYGIEFEYLIIDQRGTVRDFSNLPFAQISAMLADGPGRKDATLRTGDLGIKQGYWYLEGDERFDSDGRFATMAVKGVEIRTPPRESLEQSLASLIEIEKVLIRRLDEYDLGLAIAGFNPQRSEYRLTPPLNAFERAQRGDNPSFEAPAVTTLSYGPDINISSPAWSSAQTIEITRRLNHYSPFIVPFSFSSPFFAGAPWKGLSKRSFERSRFRPSARVFVAAGAQAGSLLALPARQPSEIGRIEFKAFDAIPCLKRLKACAALVAGIALAEDLDGASDRWDTARHQKAALFGFDDDEIRRTAARVLEAAANALARAGEQNSADAVLSLACPLADHRTPAHQMIQHYHATGQMYRKGGLSEAMPLPPAHS